MLINWKSAHPGKTERSDEYLLRHYRQIFGRRLVTDRLDLDELIIAPVTRRQLEAYLSSPVQALLLVGVAGLGLGTIARALADRVAGNDVVYLTPTNHNKQKTTIINADDIAGLPTILRDKRNHRLAVVIDDADQTAPGVFERMLKLIEEPVSGVYFIFTTHRISALPATILSRTGTIRVKAPASEACRSLLGGVDAQLANQISWLAGNRPALTRRLVESGDQSQLDLISMTRAKQFMQAQRPRRVEQIDTITDRESGLALCAAIARILTVMLVGGGPVEAATIARRLDLLSETADRLSANGNVRLQLLNLAVNF